MSSSIEIERKRIRSGSVPNVDLRSPELCNHGIQHAMPGGGRNGMRLAAFEESPAHEVIRNLDVPETHVSRT